MAAKKPTKPVTFVTERTEGDKTFVATVWYQAGGSYQKASTTTVAPDIYAAIANIKRNEFLKRNEAAGLEITELLNYVRK